MFGTRPIASSTCEPGHTGFAPVSQLSLTAMPVCTFFECVAVGIQPHIDAFTL